MGARVWVAIPIEGAGLGAAGVAMLASLILVNVVRRFAARIGLVDMPNERSSHRVPTPRGGGIGIVMGTAIGLGVAVLVSGRGLSRDLAVLLGCTFLVATVGFVDDVRSLRAGTRLCIHLGAATALVLATEPLRTLPIPAPLDFALRRDIVAIPLTVLWLTAMTNFFNFMDGVDGLAGGQTVISSVGIAVAGWSGDSALVAVALAGASAAFLLFNWPPAKVFMGDVGSGAIGFLLAGLPLLAPAQRRSDAVMAVALGLTFFILDPVLTLARRAFSRKALMRAHREHLYQRLVPPGTRSDRVTTHLLAGAGLLAILGGVSFRHPELKWVAVGAAVSLFLMECRAAFGAPDRPANENELVSGRTAPRTEVDSR